MLFADGIEYFVESLINTRLVCTELALYNVRYHLLDIAKRNIIHSLTLNLPKKAGQAYSWLI